MREGYRKPTANGIPGESRCEYVRPWEGGNVGVRGQRGGVGRRGTRGGGGEGGNIGEGDGADGVEGRSMDVDEGEESGRSAQLLSVESASAE